MKILDIKPLGQRDSRWALQRLGMVDNTTIGSDGCVVTSHCMNLTFHGKPMFPNELDDFLTEKGLYYDAAGDGPISDNLWIPNNISKVWDKMKFVTTIYCYTSPAPIEKIKDAIDRNQPPTLWLMNNGVGHNVLAVGHDGNQIYVADPWIGDIIRIDKRWGNSADIILSVDFYEGPMPIPAEQTITILVTTNEANVFKATQHDKTCKNWQFSDPRNTTAEQIDATIQKSINAYKGQASTAQTAQAQTETKLSAALQEVKNRIEQIGRITDDSTKKSEAYEAEIEALKKLPNPNDNLIITLKAQIEEYKTNYDTAMKDKGRALIELESVKTDLKTCQNAGVVPTRSLWEVIIDFLKNTKVIKQL